ncbi:PIN2/TERF1-interacting telomerase inhibitor 1 [Polymixia lowei]
MSMLAETRKKQKWSIDPRNSAWSNDDSKFGQKMLERMGWSKGKGLGRSEQGSTEHITVKLKNNSLGLGTTASHEDNWIAHQDDFNQLLADLNNCHGQNNEKDHPSEEKQGFSLEEKSKTSKKRLHYKKFTKGKDLSSRSETDLNCIFGKRAKPAKDQEEENNSSASQGEKEENVVSTTSEPDVESITKTVTSTLSMQDYFAQRMAQLKRARGQAQDPETRTSKISGPSEEPDAIHSTNDSTDEPKKKKKKKKKKKNREVADEAEVAAEECIVTTIMEDNEDQEQARSEKKKKKRKLVDNEGAMNEECSTTSGLGENCNNPSKKKKDKHEIETSQLNGHSPTENHTVESGVGHKKKKKKHREQVDSVMAEQEELLVVKKSKKDKKKKRE